MTSIATYIASNLLTSRRVDIWRESLAGIGKFEIQLENQGNIYGGTINSQNAVELKLNDVSMMKGYVDDVLPNVDDSIAVYRNLMRVTGRDWGQPLANLFFTHEWTDNPIMEIFSDCFLSTGADIEPNYLGTPPSPSIAYSSKNQYLLDSFRDIVKLTDHDFWMTDELLYGLPRLDVCPISTPQSSGVTLKAVAGASDNNILALPEIGEKVGFDIRNYIHIEAGDVDDHWTEGNASDFSGYHVTTIIDDSSIFLSGKSSIKATISDITMGTYPRLYIQLPKHNYDLLDFSVIGQADCSVLARHNIVTGTIFLCLYAMDDAGNEIFYRPSEAIKDKWKRITAPVGIDVEIKGGLDEWNYSTGSEFSWKLARIGMMLGTAGVGLDENIWIDGLRLGSITATAIADEGAPYGGHRKRMIPITRNDIKSQLQLNALAASELAKRKDPTQKLTVTATFQSGCKYAGQTVVVKAPSSGIGTAETGVTYRILSLHHAAEPRRELERGFDAITEFDLIKHETASVQPTDPLRFKLTRNPQWTYIQRLEERIRNLERG